MKPEQIFKDLLQLYDKLGIEIRLLSPNSQDYPQSGMVKIRGKKIFFLQTQLSLEEKIELLKKHLKNEDLDKIYLVPFLRRFLEDEKEA